MLMHRKTCLIPILKMPLHWQAASSRRSLFSAVKGAYTFLETDMLRISECHSDVAQRYKLNKK